MCYENCAFPVSAQTKPRKSAAAVPARVAWRSHAVVLYNLLQQLTAAKLANRSSELARSAAGKKVGGGDCRLATLFLQICFAAKIHGHCRTCGLD